MIEKTLTLLLEGRYICPIAYREGFEDLSDPATCDKAKAWLQTLGMRLTRIGEAGAFFMSRESIREREITQVKNDLLKFRDTYGPAVRMLDLLRQTKPGYILLAPGDYIQLVELETSMLESSSLEAQLRALVGVIAGSAPGTRPAKTCAGWSST